MNTNYCITYTTKRGAGRVILTPDTEKAIERMKWLHKRKIKATVTTMNPKTLQSETIGMVYHSQNGTWNWILDTKPNF